MSTDHAKQVKSTIRKNNIFGEREDDVIISFLSKGGDGAFYMPSKKQPEQTHPEWLIGRTNKQLYIARILHLESPETKSNLAFEDTAELGDMAQALNATPVYAVHFMYCKRVKWFSLPGDKLVSFV